MGMDIGILGGGFGMYGYMPAAIQNGYSVSTLNKYRGSISARPEISCFSQEIDFVDNEEDLLDKVEFLVIARDPENQVRSIDGRLGQFDKLFLEKPLGLSIEKHQTFLADLKQCEQNFSVGYLIPYTEWFKALDLTNIGNLQIEWHCVINSSSWKSRSFSDRGLFSYFGIHMIPLLCAISPKKIEIEWLQKGTTLVVKAITEHGTVNLIFSENSYASFSIFQIDLGSKRRIYESVTPFGIQGLIGAPDPRIPLLSDYMRHSLSSLDVSDSLRYEDMYLTISKRITQHETNK
jgi:hypothetical protein